jgi:subtilisin family serine protease
VKSSFLVGIVCAGTLIGAPFSSAADQADPAKPRPERETVRVAPLAVVPTGTRLENLIRSSEILIVGATNDRQATTLLRAAGARPLLTRMSLWAVGSDRIKSLIAKANRPGLRLIRFVEPASFRAETVEPMPPRKPYAFTDPLAAPQYSWHLYAVGANQVPTASPGFPITVFDSGLDTAHPDFVGRPNTFLLNTQSVAFTPDDYHGTMVASTAAAAFNGVGTEGVYSGAALRSYDFDYTTLQSYAQGFAATLQAGPSVINMSFGSEHPSRAEYELMIAAFEVGSVLVAASGNEYAEGNPLSYPAAYPHVLTVGAVDQTGAPASFSSSGLHVDLAAPGVAIPVQHPTLPNYYLPADGTSFAAPIVSAAAAYAMTARPMEKTQLFDLVRWSARDTAAPHWDERTGYGIVDMPALLAAPLPPVDPLEPNDDIDQVKPGDMFAGGKTPINPSGKNASLRARIDFTEDPDDVYRVVLPARRKATVTVRGDDDLALDLWSPLARTVWTGSYGRLGKSDKRTTTETLALMNRSKRAAVIYAHVQLSRNSKYLTANYTLAVRITK